MPKKYKYTKAQFRAFWVGRGYRAGQKNKRIPYQNNDTLNSFRAGYASAKSAVEKYPKLEKKKKKSVNGKVLKQNKNLKLKKFGKTNKRFFKPKQKIQPYWMNDWFDYDSKGRIMGSYTVDGFFELD